MCKILRTFVYSDVTTISMIFPSVQCPTPSLPPPTQVYRSEGGMFLLVGPGYSCWYIQPSVEGEGARMVSGSAPLCPGSRKAATSDWYKQNNWRYVDSSEWKEGDITVSCPVHT